MLTYVKLWYTRRHEFSHKHFDSWEGVQGVSNNSARKTKEAQPQSQRAR